MKIRQKKNAFMSLYTASIDRPGAGKLNNKRNQRLQ